MRGFLDLAGGLAVLVGLIFVGLELRQNTSAVEAASLQNQTDASTNYLLLIAADEDLARIWMQAIRDPDQLSEIDALRYFLMSRSRWLRMQNAFQQWRRDALTDADWSYYRSVVCGVDGSGNARFKNTWDQHRLELVQDFVAYVEECWSKSN